ncbi:MAG: flavin reductase family protein [Deltaproteobacteria bacterium]|nr:flavin reductase family protein [Deltaproteobacteria bacterium]
MKRKVSSSHTYKLLHPKIVALVTSRSRKGKENVMACAWMTPVSVNPPLVLVCIVKEWFTSELINDSKEFVINIPDFSMIKEVMMAGTLSGRRIDKLQEMGLTVKKGKMVKSPVIEKCIAHLECKLIKRVEAGESYVFIGKVLTAYADENYFDKKWKSRANVPLHLCDDKFVKFRE